MNNFKKLNDFLKDALVIYSLAEFKEKELGESYHAFTFTDNTAIEVAYYDNKPVLIVISKNDNAYHFQIMPVVKLEQHMEMNNHEIYRIILRVNDKLELLQEDCNGMMISSFSLETNGFPTANKSFKIIKL
jgi:DNA modification methylase